MTVPSDMSAPVTRGELRDELQQLEGRFDGKLERLEGRFDQKLEKLEARLDQKLEKLEARVDHKLDKLEERFDQKLEIWGGALLARIETSEQRMVATMQASLDAQERRLLAELARHAGAIQESVSMQIRVIDEKYADLPARMSRVEAAVFGPKPG